MKNTDLIKIEGKEGHAQKLIGILICIGFSIFSIFALRLSTPYTLASIIFVFIFFIPIIYVLYIRSSYLLEDTCLVEQKYFFKRLVSQKKINLNEILNIDFFYVWDSEIGLNWRFLIISVAKDFNINNGAFDIDEAIFFISKLTSRLSPIESFNSVINTNNDRLIFSENILKINDNQIVKKFMVTPFKAVLITESNQELTIDIQENKVWWLIFQCIEKGIIER